jgi:hypothetical protein
MVHNRDGIVLTGGVSINANQVRVGAGVRLSQTVQGNMAAIDPALHEIRVALESLASEMAVRHDVPNAPVLASNARELANEVVKPRPESGRVEILLSRLAAGTKSAGDLALSVATLKAAVFGLLGVA